MIRYYCIGLSILIVAILANGLAQVLHVKTWYAFLNEITANQCLKGSLKFTDFLWLFIFYPLLLG